MASSGRIPRLNKNILVNSTFEHNAKSAFWHTRHLGGYEDVYSAHTS